MGLFSGATNLFRGIGNVFNKQSGFTDAFGGGNWKDRFAARNPEFKLPLPTVGQLGEMPMPNENNIMTVAARDVAMGKIISPAFMEGGSGFNRLGRNLEATGNAFGKFINNPQATLDQWGREYTRATQGGPSDSGGSSSSTSSSSSNEIPQSTTDLTKKDPEEERRRLDAIRRMLAGRYGRSETNLTGGKSYGSGAGRSIGGMSG